MVAQRMAFIHVSHLENEDRDQLDVLLGHPHAVGMVPPSPKRVASTQAKKTYLNNTHTQELRRGGFLHRSG
jgi:hypothetical protein